jgi:hypothetical protein
MRGAFDVPWFFSANNIAYDKRYFFFRAICSVKTPMRRNNIYIYIHNISKSHDCGWKVFSYLEHETYQLNFSVPLYCVYDRSTDVLWCTAVTLYIIIQLMNLILYFLSSTIEISVLVYRTRQFLVYQRQVYCYNVLTKN